MGRTCSSCGVVTAPEARFCRHCGAVVKAAATLGDGETVSPLAQTIPLDGSGHPTSGLSTDNAGSSASDTQRVERAEMERLLRRSRFETKFDKRDDAASSADADYAAPQTGELTPRASIPAAVSAPAQTIAHSARQPRSRRAWMMIALLLVTLSGAVLAYYFLSQRAQKNAGEVTAVTNSNSAVEAANVNSSAETVSPEEVRAINAGAQPDETPRPTPKPSASSEPPRDTRQREGQAPALVTNTSVPAPTAAPVVQEPPTTAPPPAPAPVNDNSGTPVEANTDAFFFQAVNLVNGRDPRSLQRAELLRALQLFQNVKSGAHAAAARREAARLGKELDRRRKYSQP